MAVSLPTSRCRRTPRDGDFDAVRELLFVDHDVLLLFGPSLDWIEAPDWDLDEHRLSPTFIHEHGSCRSPTTGSPAPGHEIGLPNGGTRIAIGTIAQSATNRR